MSIQVTNNITGDGGNAKEVVFCLHLPAHEKHSNHLTKGESDSFEWGIGGKCDDKPHTVSCKVNIPGRTDAHPQIEDVYSGASVVVAYDAEKKVYVLT